MEENFVREKGKIAASIMCSGFDQVMDYVHEFERNNIEFYMWMSWTVRLSQTLHMVRIL